MMIEIRPLTRNDDFTALISLSRAFFKEFEAYHLEFFKVKELLDQDITDYFASFCDRKERRAFIAVEANRMVGYITLYIVKQEHYWQVNRIGEISGLMVQQEYRKIGIAQKLLERAREFFASRDVQYFMVYTSVNNRLGLSFYERNGLVPLYTTMLGEILSPQR